MKKIVIDYLSREIDSSTKHLDAKDCEQVFDAIIEYLVDKINLLDLEENSEQ